MHKQWKGEVARPDAGSLRKQPLTPTLFRNGEREIFAPLVRALPSLCRVHRRTLSIV